MSINLNSYSNVYLIGIGGIGMSALARYFAHNKLFVAGYDSTKSALTIELETEGIAIHYNDSPESIPHKIASDTKNTLVVYTPAIPQSHNELAFFKTKGYSVVKRAVTLGLITKEHTTAAVAGTHGKTSTSAMLAHLLQNTPLGSCAFLGGIAKNFSSNLIVNNSQRMVVEADEFDRSFHHLSPNLAIITSIDADHLDIYNNHNEIVDAFSIFIRKIQPNGTLIVKKGLEQIANKTEGIKVYTYSATQLADFYLSDICISNGLYTFTLNTPFGVIEQLTLGIPGKYNVENAIAASAAALVWSISPEQLSAGLKSFKGIARRFDIRYSSSKTVYIDDYAHHPEEIKAAIASVREMFPGRKVTGIFQPHLYSRTRDFANEFAVSLSQLDELILLDIYPAREEPIPGVTSNIILTKVACSHKKMSTLDNIIDELKSIHFDVLLTMGAGNIDVLATPIVELLKKGEGANEV
jgi:UDP-N-acetylmuramate--alanine ligase